MWYTSLKLVWAQLLPPPPVDVSACFGGIGQFDSHSTLLLEELRTYQLFLYEERGTLNNPQIRKRFPG